MYQILIEELNDNEVKPFTRFIVASAVLKQIRQIYNYSYNNYWNIQQYNHDDTLDSIFEIFLHQQLQINDICNILEEEE